MRIALWDIAAPLKDRLRPLLAASAEIVEVPAGPASPVALDVLICTRFGEPEAGRARFRLLQAAGAGTDKIALDAVDPAAWICNAYEHEVPIAEYVFAAMLEHTIGYTAMTRRIAEQSWAGAYFSRPPHGEIAGKTIGLIGLGHIGAAIAGRAKAFGMTVMAVTGSQRTSAPNVDWIATSERLDELLGRADFVVLAAPLNDATRGMLATPQFGRMKRTALLINVARAELADEGALFEALKTGVIAGAVIDPWYQYPASKTDTVAPSRFPFETLPNVRMTPHSSAWSDAVWERRCHVFAENIRRLGAAERPLNVVRAPAAGARRAGG
jgi:phosphoglycerate dehydrogenase-like enzyme